MRTVEQRSFRQRLNGLTKYGMDPERLLGYIEAFGVHAGGSQMPDVVAHLETALAGLMTSQSMEREVWQRAKSLVVSILAEMGRLDLTDRRSGSSHDRWHGGCTI
jgi:hypothetical protein